MRRPRRSTLALSCTLALAGCHDHRIGFFPETDGDDGSGPWTTTETTTLSPTTPSPTTPTTVSPTTLTVTTETPPPTVTTTDPTDGASCGELQLGQEVPLDFFGSLAGQGDEFALSCGGAGGTDVALVWQAPFTGRFEFDTVGSNFDTLLGLIDGDCFGQELACDDDSGGELRSRVQADLVEGQVVTVVIDSFGPSVGEFALHIRDASISDECPDALFEPLVPVVIDGQTAGAGNSRAGSCGGESSPDIEAMWVAPFDGLFSFRIVEADFDPVLYLWTTCEGPEMACIDDSAGQLPLVTAPLSGGQAVVIVVDGVGGQSGKFVLAIEESF